MLLFRSVGARRQLVRIKKRVAVRSILAMRPDGSPNMCRSIPVVTTINATDITGIIPIPMLRDSLLLSPESLPPIKPPSTFPVSPKITKIKINMRSVVICPDCRRYKKLKLAPIQTKNRGIKNAYPMVLI